MFARRQNELSRKSGPCSHSSAAILDRPVCRYLTNQLAYQHRAPRHESLQESRSLACTRLSRKRRDSVRRFPGYRLHVGKHVLHGAPLWPRWTHTIPSNRSMTHLPSAQPRAMKNPHTNQTNNALAETTGNIARPPFDRQDMRPNPLGQTLVQYATTAKQNATVSCSASFVRWPIRPKAYTVRPKLYWPP